MHSPNVHREAAFSIVQSELVKVDRIRRKDTSADIRLAVDVISEFLNNAVAEVEDAYDLKALRAKLTVINFFLNTVLRSLQDFAGRWALPLIRECYEALDIDPGSRTIMIVQAQENETYSVIPNVIGILRRQISIHRGSRPSQAWEAWEKEHPIIDIFTIPAEARYDISSIAMIGHEVGHIYWVIPQHRDYLSGMIKSAGGPISQAHLEEYLSDEVARYLLGPAFDFAMVKLLVSLPGDASMGCATHPAMTGRIQRCLDSLKGYRRGGTSSLNAREYMSNEELSHCLDALLENLDRAATGLPGNGRDEQDPKSQATRKLLHRMLADPNFRHKRDTFDVDLLQTWDWIKTELDALRPPFERVTQGRPVAISPRRAVIGVSLYYYSGSFAGKHNTYYRLAEGDHDAKTAFIRKTLVSQLKYVVGLYDFVKRSQDRYCDEAFAGETWDRTIWNMRERPTGPLVIVPSIHPASQYSAHAVDLRLGGSFLINRLTKFAYIDNQLLRGNSPSGTEGPRIKSFYDELQLPVGAEFILHPHQFILAGTLEYIALPEDIYGMVLGRSSWGRLGLNIATATSVQAGFKGCLTLELRNLGETPLSLKVGLRIAQLTLISLPEKGSAPAAIHASKYSGSVHAEVSKLHRDPDWDVLEP